MEKSWENFWTTGKVEDYLTYRSSVSEEKKECLGKTEAERTGERERNSQEGLRSTWDSR